MEAIEHDIMIETRVTILVRVLGIPTRGLIKYIFTILYQIDRLTIGHSVLVNQISRRVMNDIVMVDKTSHLRTKNL